MVDYFSASNPMASPFGALTGTFLVLFIILAILIYIYTAWALMDIAKRLKTKNAWLAWIPIANVYLMAKMAKKSPWPLWLLLLWIPALLIFVSPVIGWIFFVLAIIGTIIFGIFQYIWIWKICEARGRPGWWAILSLVASVLGAIPLIGIIFSTAGAVWSLVLFGILAWGKK